MRTSVKTLVASAVLGCSALASVPAFAGETDAPSDFTVSGYVQGVSDYRFRGISASAGDPAIQGSINVNHASGFYAGAWASSLQETDVYGSTELDLYAGWTREVAPGLTFDAGLTYYVYPSGEVGHANFVEPYAAVSTTIGPVTAKVGAAYAWKQKGVSNDDNVYVYTDLGTAIPNTPVTLAAHLGYQSGPLAADPSYDRIDYSVGANYAITKNLSVGVAYVGVDGPSVNSLTDDTALVTVKLAL